MTKFKQSLLLSLGIVLVIILLSSGANPDSPELYKVKRIQEKVFFIIQPTPARKAAYYRALLNIRAQELENLVKSKSYNYIVTSSLRYSATAGNLTELIKQNNLSDQKAPTIEEFKTHQRFFESLVSGYPTDDNEEWKYIQDDVNYLAIYTGFLRE